jgi:flavin reductase (DIM6/NTAB) family NADH-FMN oxidoreductase RutF
MAPVPTPAASGGRIQAPPSSEFGEPRLHAARTWLRVKPRQLLAAGDSTLVMCFVTEAHCALEPAGDVPAPLIYHDGQYLRAARFQA